MSLTIKNLCKSFDGKTVLDNFSHDFADRGIYAIQGESGAGKTTLLRIIAGLDKDYSGEVIGGGFGKCSMAFQEHRLFPQLSALENVVFAISDKKDEAVCKKATDILTSLGLPKSDISLLPEELSGGMKQRVSLARAFIKDAPVLLLDEPTKELDEANATLVRDMIREAAKSRLVILATHSAEDVEALEAKIIKI